VHHHWYQFTSWRWSIRCCLTTPLSSLLRTHIHQLDLSYDILCHRLKNVRGDSRWLLLGTVYKFFLLIYLLTRVSIKVRVQVSFASKTSWLQASLPMLESNYESFSGPEQGLSISLIAWTCHNCTCRYLDILSKYKPKIQWNSDTAEHIFTFKYDFSCKYLIVYIILLSQMTECSFMLCQIVMFVECLISWPTTMWGPAIVMVHIVHPSVCLSLSEIDLW